MRLEKRTKTETKTVVVVSPFEHMCMGVTMLLLLFGYFAHGTWVGLIGPLPVLPLQMQGPLAVLFAACWLGVLLTETEP